MKEQFIREGLLYKKDTGVGGGAYVHFNEQTYSRNTSKQSIKRKATKSRDTLIYLAYTILLKNTRYYQDHSVEG